MNDHGGLGGGAGSGLGATRVDLGQLGLQGDQFALQVAQAGLDGLDMLGAGEGTILGRQGCSGKGQEEGKGEESAHWWWVG